MASVRFSIEPLFGSGVTSGLLMVFLMAALWWILPPNLGHQRRRVLRLLRLIAALMLMVMLWRPGLVREDNRPSSAILTLAIDTSRSMTLSSGRSASRWEQQGDFLRQFASELAKLDDELQIRVLTYGDQVDRVADATASNLINQLEIVAQSTPNDTRTDLSKPLKQAVQLAASDPMAGVVLLSDGTQTGTEQTSAEARQSAELIASLNVPLWTIPLGPPSDITLSKDLSIAGLPETIKLFAGNDADIGFQTRMLGLAGQNAEISLVWQRLNDDRDEAASGVGSASPEVAATRVVRADSNDDTKAVSVSLRAPEPGRYRLIVRGNAIDGEVVTSNNTQIAFVDVREGGGRVLYVEGAIRLEQQYVRRALRRFPDLDLTFRWIPSDTRDQWPIELDVPWEPDRVDAVILGDLNADAISDESWQQLADSVAEGVALITLGGFNAYGSGGYDRTAVAAALPIVMTPRGEDQIETPIGLVESGSHPITMVMQGGKRLDWRSLPTMPGANRWERVKTAAGTRVILTDQSEQPMMAVGSYGGGRVASLAFDSTWLWWRNGYDEVHRRFWRQLILWALSREEQTQEEISVELSSRRFASSSQAEFRASISNVSEIVSLLAEVELESGERRSVGQRSQRRNADSSTVSVIAGELSNLPPGFHQLVVSVDEAMGIDFQTRPTRIEFQVIDDTMELTQSQTNHELLRQLSAASADWGGQVFRDDQVEELIDQIRVRRTNARQVTIQRSRIGDGPMTAWPMLVVFVGCLGLTWWLRRRWGLA
ncbi:MAG: glutamine amidotransferase [Planctomycetota bacterium]